MGNSEVGHLNIGAGRIVQQDVTLINKDIQTGKFFKNPVLLHAFKTAKKHKSRVHLIGLISPATVHSSMAHLFALLDLAKIEKYSNVCIHAITDGRDSAPTSALE
jgi:2,3-bisphosphoglycerate-independent phosphoglycerate mutase